MLYAFFWVILRHQNFICRRFGTLCLFHFHRRVPTHLWRRNRQSVPKRRHIKFRRREITQKKTYNRTNVVVELIGKGKMPWRYKRGTGGTAPCILNLSIRWSERSASHTGHCIPGETVPVLIKRRLVGPRAPQVTKPKELPRLQLCFFTIEVNITFTNTITYSKW
jgi:hypothetical protein